MCQVLTRSAATSVSVAPSCRSESADASGSSSVADPVSQAPAELVHRPTFGISLSELKAAIAPRARHIQGTLDETDRFLLVLHPTLVVAEVWNRMVSCVCVYMSLRPHCKRKMT